MNMAIIGKYAMFRVCEADPKLPSTATIFDYPMRGEFLTLKDAEEYCIQQGYKFRKDSSLFGGYYVEESSGRSFVIL